MSVIAKPLNGTPWYGNGPKRHRRMYRYVYICIFIYIYVYLYVWICIFIIISIIRTEKWSAFRKFNLFIWIFCYLDAYRIVGALLLFSGESWHEEDCLSTLIMPVTKQISNLFLQTLITLILTLEIITIIWDEMIVRTSTFPPTW